MGRAAIELDGERVVFSAGGASIAAGALGDIVRIDIVHHQFAVPGGYDDYFHVVEFADTAWVLPDDLPGSYALRAAVKRARPDADIVYAVVPAALPITWRRRLFGVLPLFPEPRPLVVARSALPAWAEQSGPYRPGDTAVGEHFS